MTLEDLGYNNLFEAYKIENRPEGAETGRVVTVHKDRYIVRTVEGEFEAEITGSMRFTAKSREDFPAVGDWVSLTTYEESFAIIHQIFPRFSILRRQAVDHTSEVQIIAANIDYAFLVQAVDRDFNINRLERYLTICNSGKVSPIIVLTKTDLADQQRIDELCSAIKGRIREIPVIPVSNATKEGLIGIISILQKGKTYCLLGSSGVGKSSLLNNLSGKALMRTDAISLSNNKGRHVTSHRELIILDNGGILIDNPGMREVGITDASGGLDITFDTITTLAKTCRFKNCTHTTEDGCAVLEAVERGEIDEASFENYQKMEREMERFGESVAERRKKERDFGKHMKNYKKEMKGKNMKREY